MLSVLVRPFRRGDRDRLTQLANARAPTPAGSVTTTTGPSRPPSASAN